MKVETEITPFMFYEHRDKNGNLISRGDSKLRRGNKLHFIQSNAKGKKMGEVIYDNNNGLVLEEISYDEKEKVDEKFTFKYNEKKELISVTDKQGVISLSPEVAEELIK